MYNARMAQPSPDRVRTFEATFRTLAEANLFLGHFICRFGYLDGHGYSVSQTGTKPSPATGPTTAAISFSPWSDAIADKDRTDFARLLAEADAGEIAI
jgi:hypothetical protein